MADTPSELLALTAEIVAAHVGNHAVAAGELPNLISSVFTALSRAGEMETPPPTDKPQPAVPIRKSVQYDYIVCLEDGRRFKTLKRYLQTRYGLTPAQYREKWGLPQSYPMVAHGYSERRAELARKAGLGRKPAPVEPEPAPAKRPVRGRRKAAPA